VLRNPCTSARTPGAGSRPPTNSPTQQEVEGPLVVRYTNVATGESIVRNLTGRALIDTFADGSSRFTLEHGHLAVGLGATDPGGPAFLVLRGRGFTVDFAADGTRTVTPGRGTIENVCRRSAEGARRPRPRPLRRTVSARGS
jgi:hypothetical protein